MFAVPKYRRAAGLLIGLLAGLILGRFWPDTPLHAVATDRNQTFAVATGPLDEDVEAVYFLDFLTGNLSARVLNRLGRFNAFFEYNVLKDLGVNPAQNPRFLMVTGVARLQRMGAALQPADSILYVAEVTTGNVAAYAVPWSAAIRNRNVPIRESLVLLDVTKFRAAAGAGIDVPPPRVTPSTRRP